MKHFIFTFISLSALSAIAQDTIFTRNGEVIPAKVYEVTPTEIKYKKPSNPDGPLYVTSKDNVALIEYKNGSKDVFQQDNAQAQTNQSNNNNSYNNDSYGYQRPRVNVMIATPPIVIGNTWGYYRPFRYHHRHMRWGWGCGWW